MAEMPLNDSRHPTHREPDSQVGTLELDEVDDVPPEGRRELPRIRTVATPAVPAYAVVGAHVVVEVREWRTG